MLILYCWFLPQIPPHPHRQGQFPALPHSLMSRCCWHLPCKEAGRGIHMVAQHVIQTAAFLKRRWQGRGGLEVPTWTMLVQALYLTQSKQGNDSSHEGVLCYPVTCPRALGCLHPFKGLNIFTPQPFCVCSPLFHWHNLNSRILKNQVFSLKS